MNQWRRGCKKNRKNSSKPDSNQNLPFEHQKGFPCRSFSKGQEISPNEQFSVNEQYSSRYQRQKMACDNNNFREDRAARGRFGNRRNFQSSNNNLQNFRYQRSESVPSRELQEEDILSENMWGPQSANFPSQNQNSDIASYSRGNNSIEREESENFFQKKDSFYQLLKKKKPTELIMEYRRDVEELAKDSIAKNLNAIEQISSWKSQGFQKDIPQAHLKNMHLQREEFENYITKVKQQLSSLSTLNNYEILQKADSILASVKSECKLFNRCLPGYSLKSNLFFKLKENQVLIISSDSSYYLNVVLPILLKKEYPHHLLLSCESIEILRSSTETNVMNLYPKEEENSEYELNNIKFFTAEEMLKFILTNPEIVKREKDFISLCKLPLKRSIIVDLLIANLRDILEDQPESKLILLLTSFDKSLKYENYFSDLDVDIITPPPLTFPIKTVWRNTSLLPGDDYIDVVIKTILSIHVLRESGDIMVFLPSIAEIKSALINLQKKLSDFCFDDIEFILLHENSEQVEWLNMCFRKTSPKRCVFFVTDCAESFVLSSVSYVIDCGLRKEHIFDPSKKLDVLTSAFISCDKAKLRKSLAGIFNVGTCYRLYSKENYCEEMTPNDYPEMLTINPFNAMIKIFQFQQNHATKIEFVESLSSEVKERTLNLLNKSNAIKNDKLTPLGERIVKLPFPPLYSKLISVGIEWELGYEAIILVAFFSVKGKIFQFNNNKDIQRKIDAIKLQLIQKDSDSLSYLYIYKLWLENNESSDWCKKFCLNQEVMKLAHIKVTEICEVVGKALNKNMIQEFSKSEGVTNLLLELLFECFKINLCVFTGHNRSGYRMLSSRCIAFLHPSSLICQSNEMPQFIIFDRMISNKRDFLIDITTIPYDIVMNAMTNQALDFDYSDMFENNLVEKIIEPVGERIINQVLLGKKGHKLKEIEQSIKNLLCDESVVIEPSVERGRIAVFASKDCIDNAVQCVEEIIKQEYSKVLDSEETHILTLRKGLFTLPIELKWVKGAKVKSLKVSSQKTVESKRILKVTEGEDDVPYAIKKSISISWIRRKCNGRALVAFSPEHFMLVRRFAMRNICLLGSEVFVSIDDNSGEYSLTLTGIPDNATSSDVIYHLKKLMPHSVDFKKVEMKYEPPFETSQTQIHDIKEMIEDACRKHTQLIDFQIIVETPKNTSTIFKAFINVSDDEDIVPAAESLSNNLDECPGINCKPVFNSVIQSSLKMCEALFPRFKEKLSEVEQMVQNRITEGDPFKFDVLPTNNDNIVKVKMSSNNLEILQILQRTIYSLLEGDILNHNFSGNISKLFCHAGLLWLKSLEEAHGVHIVSDQRTKSVRLFGSQKKCHQVKQQILQFILDCEHEVAKEISLFKINKSRILLKALLMNYGVNLENFISSCGLRLAILNIKSCSLSLHGNQESIDSAERVLDELAQSVDLESFSRALEDVETCPVCACPTIGETYRLEICGHLYCCDCIMALVDQAQFPLKCCLDGCDKELIIDDIIKILELQSKSDQDSDKLNVLLEKSMKKYLNEHQTDFIYCPAPDCSMFFSKKDISTTKHTCPLCLNEICINCNVVYHHGFSCDMYQGSKNDPDYSFKIWQQNTDKCKQCPKCRTAIEKSGGCDHMTCKTCDSHFCWVCVQEFPNASAVYEHIPFCTKYQRW